MPQVRFHLGTMAAGSFILATLTVARAALAYLDAKTKDLQGGSSLLKCALKCAQCCLWVFHRIVKFLTKFAFVAVATDGQPFCAAAFASFHLTTDHPLQMLANEAAMAVLSLLQLILTPLLCALLAYNSVAWQWRTNLLEAWGAINAWGDAVCGQYQSDTVDACGYKATVLGFLSSTTTLTDWPADEKPNELRVVTRTFRSVYAAAVDTIFVCCVRSEDEEVGRLQPCASWLQPVCAMAATVYPCCNRVCHGCNRVSWLHPHVPRCNRSCHRLQPCVPWL